MVKRLSAAGFGTGAFRRYFSNTLPKIEVKIPSTTATSPAPLSVLASSRLECQDTDPLQEVSTDIINDVSAARNSKPTKNIGHPSEANTFFSNYEATVLESHLNEDGSISQGHDILATTTLLDHAEYLPIGPGPQTSDDETRFDVIHEVGDSHEHWESDQRKDEILEDRLLADDHRSMLDAALARGDAYSEVQALSDDAFSETLMRMQPSTFVNRITSLHMEFSSSKVRQLGITPVNEVARAYSNYLTEFAAARRRGGSTLSLADYTVLLRSARDLGNHKMARDVWNALLKDGHSPDVDCYNYYMAAYVWNGRHRPQHRQRIRITPFNAKIRLREQRRAKFRALDIGSADTLIMAQYIFNMMWRKGVEPNEESYCTLIVAAARQGRLSEVNNILRKTWAIDVDAIQRGESGATKIPEDTAEDIPERPSGTVLVAIAHAFGINNDILTALRVVDHVAQRHGIPIDVEVWSQLFEWTYVLSIDRTGTSKRNGSNVGQLPSQSLQRLWDTMTGEPYCVQPTMRMYDLVIKDLSARSQTPAMVARMMEALALYENHRDEASAAFKRFKAAAAEHDDDEQDAKDLPLGDLRREWEYLNLLRRRDVYLLKRWMSLLLQSFDEWHRMDFVDRHYACGLPALLWEWREWAPTTVKYEIPTAFVEFKIRTRDEIALRAQRKVDAQLRQRRILDTAPRLVGQDWL